MERTVIRLLLALTLTACGASEDAAVEGAAEPPSAAEAPAAVVPQPVPVDSPEADPATTPVTETAAPSTGEPGLQPEGTAAAQVVDAPSDPDPEPEEPLPLNQDVIDGFGGGGGGGSEGVGIVGQGRIGAPSAPARVRRRGARRPARAGRSESSAFDIEE